jgi:uncharacterized membrane protein
VSHVRTSLWFVPSLCVLVGVATSILTLWLDRTHEFELIPQRLVGSPDVALFLLSSIAASMVSLAALVLTITMVVVQLAMGQFSPRIVQTYLQDKPSQLAIGLFVATFAHALVSMREIDVARGRVPGLAILVALVMVLVSIVVLVLYVHHIGQSLRVASLIELVGDKTRRLVDDLYPDHGPAAAAGPTDRRVVPAPRSGVVNHVHHTTVVAAATKAGVTLELVPGIGEFVPAGAPLFLVIGDPSRLDEDAVVSAVVLGLERTFDQDVAYGLRLLVDIAERSLADSAFQDPTTAVQAIDRIHDCLRQLARRPFPSGLHRDEQGTVRLRIRPMAWDALVHLAFDEVRLAGAESPPVTRRLRAALEDLRSIAPRDRQAALDLQLELLAASTASAGDDHRDVAFAQRADGQGIGVDATGSEWR